MILLVGFVVVAAFAALWGARPKPGAPPPVPIRAAWMPAVEVLAQTLVINVLPDVVPQSVAVTVHLTTYLVVAAWVVANLRVRGLWLVGLGGMLNFLAIAANGGVMPASPAALETAGIPAHEGFSNSAAVEDARLQPLGDVFAIPAHLPFANVFSIGDVILLVGAAAVLGSRRDPSATETTEAEEADEADETDVAAVLEKAR